MSTRTEDTLEGIEGIGRKSTPAWWMMEGDQIKSYHEKEAQDNLQGLSAVDTIASANPNSTREIESKTVAAESTPSAKSPRYLEVIDWGKKMWAYFFTRGTVASTETSAANKGSVDPITGLGAPNLEPPYQIDLKQLELLLKELKELNVQIQDINNESEEELKKNQSRYTLYALVEYFKIQKQLTEECSVEIKYQIIFNQRQDKDIRKEQGDADQIRIEAEQSQRFWTNVNFGLTVVSMTGTAVVVGVVAWSTLGAGAVAVPALVDLGFKVTKCAVDLCAGGATLIKTKLDQQVGSAKEKIEILNARHLKVSFMVKVQVDQMNAGWNSAEKLTKGMIDMLKSYQEAVQGINAR